MGVSYSASVIVGLPENEFTCDIGLLEEWLDLDKLVRYGTYDAEYDEVVVGLEFAQSGDYTYAEFVYDPDKIEALKEKFFRITGQFARVFLVTYGY